MDVPERTSRDVEGRTEGNGSSEGAPSSEISAEATLRRSVGRFTDPGVEDVAGHTGEDESIAGVPEDTRRGQDASSLEIPAGGTQRSGIVVGGQSSRNVVG